MARSASCPSCSAKVPREAGYCAACGHALGVELDLASFDEDDELARQPQVVEPERPHGLRNLLIGGGVVAALVAAAVLVGRDEPPEVATPPTTTVARTTAASTTTTIWPRMIDLGRPLLPEPTGAVLYALGGGGLARIEPDSGRVVVRRLAEIPPEGDARLVARQGSVVVVSPGPGSLLVPDQAGAPPVELGHDWYQVLPGPAADEIWRVGSREEADGISPAVLQRWRIDGTPTGPAVTLPPFHQLLDDGAGGLVLVSFGASYELDGDSGTVRRVLDGSAVAVSGDRLVDLRCDDRLKCRWRVTERAGGDQRLLAQPPSEQAVATMQFGSGVLSPDGAWMAYDDPLGHLRVVDVRDGTERDLGANNGFCCQRFAWSPDGRWLFFPQAGGVRAWRAGAPEAVELTAEGLPETFAVAAAAA